MAGRPPHAKPVAHTGTCRACGRDVELHYTGQQMVGCAGAVEQEPVNRGRLLQLKLKSIGSSRANAHQTIRPLTGLHKGMFEARIGGRLHGKRQRFASRQKAEGAVDAHYNEQAMRAVLASNGGREIGDGDATGGTTASGHR